MGAGRGVAHSPDWLGWFRESSRRLDPIQTLSPFPKQQKSCFPPVGRMITGRWTGKDSRALGELGTRTPRWSNCPACPNPSSTVQTAGRLPHPPPPPGPAADQFTGSLSE